MWVYPHQSQTANGNVTMTLLAIVLGMRAIGKGRATAATLSAYVGLPSPVTDRQWKRLHNIIDQM